MEGEELKVGKQRVFECLIEPLNQLGFARKRGETVAAHNGIMGSLAARLAYMTADNLLTLAEVVENKGFGPDNLNWPPVKFILTWACSLQKPAPSVSRLVRTFLQSAPGREALDSGHIVELFWFLKKNGIPPTGRNMDDLRSEAAQNRSDLTRIEESRAAGRVTEQDLQWEQYYLDTLKGCRKIVAAKPDGVQN